MMPRIPTTLRESRTLQVVLAGFVTIFLGAIGSGLWELVLSKVFQALANGFLTLMSHLFHGYVDILHRNIGKGVYGQLEALPYVLIVVAFVMGPWILFLGFMFTIRRLRRRIVRSLETDQGHQLTPELLLADLDRIRRRSLWLMLPAAALVSLLYAEDFIETSYTVRAARFIERSIDIVAPAVDHQTLLRLRAAYRSIDNATTFYALENEIRAIARAKSITLPDFKSIK